MITSEYRKQVFEALINNKANYPTTSEAQYAKSFNVSPAIYSRIKNGEIDKIVSDSLLIQIGRKLNVGIVKRELKLARTSVYEQFEETIHFCKKFSKSTIVTDECGVGKTRCSKHIISQLPNSFYVDCSQAKTLTQFVRLLAQTLGLDNTGKISDIKENIKYYLNLIETPIVLLDDAGYLDFKVFVEIIEFWNATDKSCAWMMLGDDSFQTLLEKGLRSKKKGFRALFSRFSDECVHFVPQGSDRQDFMMQLIGDVANVNVTDKQLVNKLVKLCLAKGKTLRHLETLIDLELNYDQNNISA